MRKALGKEGDLARKKTLESGNHFKEGKTFDVGKTSYGGNLYKKENLRQGRKSCKKENLEGEKPSKEGNLTGLDEASRLKGAVLHLPCGSSPILPGTGPGTVWLKLIGLVSG